MITKYKIFENDWDIHGAPMNVSSPEEAFARRDYWFEIEKEREEMEKIRRRKLRLELIDPYNEEEWDNMGESINLDLDPYEEEDWNDENYMMCFWKVKVVDDEKYYLDLYSKFTNNHPERSEYLIKYRNPKMLDVKKDECFYIDLENGWDLETSGWMPYKSHIHIDTDPFGDTHLFIFLVFIS